MDAKKAWEIVGAITSTYEARQAYNIISHMENIDKYTFIKLTQVINEQYKRFRKVVA